MAMAELRQTVFGIHFCPSTMASLEASLHAAGGDPAPPAPEPVVVDNEGQEAGGNVEEEGQEAAIFVRPSHGVISTLPAEFLSFIVSFLPEKDRLSMCLMNRTFLEAVEGFSREKYEEISEKYREKADETWERRITHGPNLPDPLPFRYLLKKSFKTHLYVLNDCRVPLPLPDGKRLVGIQGGRTHELRLWDLETKQSKLVYEGLHLNYELLMCDDLAVSVCFVGDDHGSFVDAVVARNLDGELVHSASFPHLCRLPARWCSCANKSKVFFAFEGSDMLNFMDVVTGEVRENILSFSDQSDRRRVKIHQVVTVEDSLVVLCRQVGIYVFDTNNFAQTYFWSGRYFCVGAASNSLETILSRRPGRQTMNVFALSKDGILSLRNTFSLFDSHIYSDAILLVHESLVFVQPRDAAPDGIEVYNILDGEFVRTLSLPDHERCERVATNGSELFCGMDHWGDGFHTHAFPLEKL